MATIIDSLIVTLGLDPKGFSAGSKKARGDMAALSDEAKKRAAQIEKSGAQAAAFFSKLRNEALALAAVFTAGVGVKSFFESTIGSAINLGYMAKNLSMSTQELGAWQKAAQRAGGTAEGITNLMKQSALELANAKMGRSSEDTQEFYRQGGVDIRNFKTGNELLLAKSKIIKDLFAIDPSRALLVAQRLGVADQFDFVKQGPEGINKLIDAQRKNSQITEEQTQKALELNNAYLTFKDTLTTTAMQVVLKLAPALEHVMVRLQVMADWVASHQTDITKWVNDATEAVLKFAKVLDDAAKSVGGWKNVLLGILALKAASFAVSLGSIAASIAGVGLAAAESVPLLVAALTALSAYAGYKLADKLFGSEKTRLQDKNKAIINGGQGEALPPMEKVADLKKEARRQKVAAGLIPTTRMSKEELRAEADRQLVEVGLPPKNPNYKDFLKGHDGYQNKDTPDEKDARQNKNSPQNNPAYQELLTINEQRFNLPAGLLDKMWKQESNRGDPRFMKSPAGAEGHFGFMPDTAKAYGLKDPNNFADSTQAAALLMSDLLKRQGGDLNRALASYNWGEGNLQRKGMENAPIETKNYIKAINPPGAQKTENNNQTLDNRSYINNAKSTADTRTYINNVNPVGAQPTKGNVSTSDVTINGDITVHTKATDAAGVADGLHNAIQQRLMPSQSNTGLQ